MDMSDVAHAAAGMNAPVETDDRQGGHAKLEKAAIKGHDSVLELQQRNVGERLLRALYALAAEYSTSAAWSCIDARNLDQTQRHLNESATYVGLSQDGPTETRVTGQPLGSTSLDARPPASERAGSARGGAGLASLLGRSSWPFLRLAGARPCRPRRPGSRCLSGLTSGSAATGH